MSASLLVYAESLLAHIPDTSEINWTVLEQARAMFKKGDAWKRVSKSDVKFIGGFIKPKEDQAPKLLDESAAAGAGDQDPW